MNHDIFSLEATLEKEGTFKVSEFNQIIDEFQEVIKQDIPSYQVKQKKKKKKTIETENLNSSMAAI
jgi:hypothetical protein